MMREFRDLLLVGTIVELAVAFVMGVVFTAVVSSFVDDLLMHQELRAIRGSSR